MFCTRVSLWPILQTRVCPRNWLTCHIWSILQASGAFTAQQLELEKLKVVSNCFSNIQYTGPRMMQQQQMLVASMLRNMGMPELMPSMQTASTGGVSAMTVVGSEPGMGSTKVE